MQLYLHLYATTDARLCFNNNIYITIEKQVKSKVVITTEKNFFIEFTPINNNSLSSFLCELQISNDTLTSKSTNINIIKLDINNYYIIFNPGNQNTINILQNLNQELNVKGKKIIYSNGKLEILDKMKFHQITIQNSQYNYKLTEQDGIIFLFDKNRNKNNLHIISLATYSHILTSAELYQIKDNEIQCIKNLFTFAKHKKIVCFDKQTLTKTKEFTAYKTEPNINMPQIIIPYAFMQCIQVNDYTLAQKFLDADLFTQKLTKSKIQEFFGDFFMVTTPQIKKPENTICLIYKSPTNSNLYSKYYSFEFNNANKIQNIKPVN